MLAERYFSIIRISIDQEQKTLPSLKDSEWYDIYEFANRQAILGVVFDGVKVLGKIGKKPPLDLLFKWIASVEQIRGQNARLNRRSVEVLQELCSAGYECCLLKGQGNAIMYSNPFVRQCGDIDVLLRNANRNLVSSYVKYKKK